MSVERHSLTSIISEDLCRFGKLPLLLVVLVFCSAIAVVLSTHRTRLLIVEREHLVLERDALDIEWRNLILEENALGEHNRVERLSGEKLQMQRVSPAQEKVVKQ
ncbi:cell division protein FtsL [Plesiomonas sp.]|uniref:cell division protein FtsL n=1 Tax=Plesiomonas sp. TaxID=2486279 RepID=UPI003F415A88